MKKEKSLLLLLLPLSLVSCNTGKPGQSLADQKLGLGIFKNGEIINTPLSGHETYSSFCIGDDGTGAAESLMQGENVFIIQAADNCSHCKKLEPRLCEFLSLYHVKTYLFDAPSLADCSNVKEAFEKVAEVCPGFVYDLAFPKATLISAELEFESFTFSGHMSSIEGICDLLLTKFHEENIIAFQEESSFISYLKDNGGTGYVYSSLEEFNKTDKENILKRDKDFPILYSTSHEQGYYSYTESGLTPVLK